MKCRTPEEWNFLSEIWGTMDWPKLSMLFKWTVTLTCRVFLLKYDFQNSILQLPAAVRTKCYFLGFRNFKLKNKVKLSWYLTLCPMRKWNLEISRHGKFMKVKRTEMWNSKLHTIVPKVILLPLGALFRTFDFYIVFQPKCLGGWGGWGYKSVFKTLKVISATASWIQWCGCMCGQLIWACLDCFGRTICARHHCVPSHRLNFARGEQKGIIQIIIILTPSRPVGCLTHKCQVPSWEAQTSQFLQLCVTRSRIETRPSTPLGNRGGPNFFMGAPKNIFPTHIYSTISWRNYL